MKDVSAMKPSKDFTIMYRLTWKCFLLIVILLIALQIYLSRNHFICPRSKLRINTEFVTTDYSTTTQPNRRRMSNDLKNLRIQLHKSLLDGHGETKQDMPPFLENQLANDENASTNNSNHKIALSDDVHIPKHVPIHVHYFNKPEWVKEEWFHNCEYKCFLTHGGNSFKSYAVIFHAPTLHRNAPKKRNGQVWISHFWESTLNFYGARKLEYYKKWKNKFNFTLSFRRDSDTMITYGRFEVLKKHRNETDKKLQVWLNKTDVIAAAVSNCNSQSKRLSYLKELKKYLPIHIYGKCGKYKSIDFRKALETNYKFYLSFENSLCVDYITEKGFRLYQDCTTVIPITRGMGKDYAMYLPPRSFVNTADFPSPEMLSRYVSTLLQNQSLTRNFFAWQNYYRSPKTEIHREAFCELCRKLHHKERYQNLYREIGAWFNMEPYKQTCKDLGLESPHDLY